MDPLSIAGELSTLGLVPFLVYGYIMAGKRQDLMEEKMDAQRKEADARFEMMTKGWQKQLDGMMEKNEARETELRDRFDKTVEKLDGERTAIQNGLVEETRALSARVEDVIRFISRPAGR